MYKKLFFFIITILTLYVFYKLVYLIIKYKTLKKSFGVSAKNNLFCTKFTPPCDIIINNNLSIPTSFSNNFNPYTARYCIDLISRIIAIYLPPTLKQLYLPPNLHLLAILPYEGEYTIMGYIAIDNNKNIWIVFRGSLDKTDMREDMIYKQTDLIVPFTHDNNIKCHQGFINVYSSFREKITNIINTENPKNIIITGHSLGSGLATLASYELGSMGYNIYTYTFASPRVGNIHFANEVNRVTKAFYRVVNLSDIVPTIPIAVMPNMNDTNNPFIYKHTGIAIEFDQNWKSIENNHMIYNYRNYINTLL